MLKLLSKPQEVTDQAALVGRCVGVDTELLDADVQRSQVAQLSDQASKRGRVVLTRDHKLAEQRGLSAVYLLACDDAKQQFQDIQKRFGIRWSLAYVPATVCSFMMQCLH